VSEGSGAAGVNIYEIFPAGPDWRLSKRRGRILGDYDRPEAAVDVAKILARANMPSEVWLYEAGGGRRLVVAFPEDDGSTPAGS
jgi:hypothetical protein